MQKFEGFKRIENIRAYLNALSLEPRIEKGYLTISPVSDEEILSGSHGEVTKPETFKLRTLKPDENGLFSQKIFGPVKNWECGCGKYKRVKHKGTICDRCDVEVTLSNVRDERMGHISLAAPVVHALFQEYLAKELGLELKELQNIIYYKEDNTSGASGLRELLNKKGKDDKSWMILEKIAVLPPGIRPLTQAEEVGKLYTADSNDLYRRVIDRNNRLKKLIELDAPEVIISNEKRMLQETVEGLFDNGYRGRAICGKGKRPLESLTDVLEGNLKTFWRKSCEYSVRGVAVYEQGLAKERCKAPEDALFELYEPLVVHGLLEAGKARTKRTALAKIVENDSDARTALKEAIKSRPMVLIYSTQDRAKVTAVWPEIDDHEAISISPGLYRELGLKGMGERVDLHLPLSQDAVKETISLVGRIVDGDGKFESAFSSLVDQENKKCPIKPLIELVISKGRIPLSEMEKYLIVGG